MTCLRARCAHQETILFKSLLLCPYLVFVNNGSSFATAARWTVILGLSYFRYLLVSRMARNHWVLIVIVSLPGKQVILVHFLFDISHVTVSFQCLTAFNLSIEVLLVHDDGSILLIDPVLIEHAVEYIHARGLIGIVFPLSSVKSGLLKLIIVQLLEKLPVVFTLDLLLVISGNSCPLVQHLISVGICLCLVVFVL